MAAFVGTFALCATPAEAGGRRYYKNHYGYHHGGATAIIARIIGAMDPTEAIIGRTTVAMGIIARTMAAMGIVSRTTVAMGVRPFRPYHRFRSAIGGGYW